MSNTEVFSKAAVAAPHHLAAEAGRAILAEGGNALEAMVAMAASIAVVYPHMNAVGGDGFWLVRDKTGKMHGIEACGPAGSLATMARYRDKEFQTIPSRGPDAALTVAGAIGGWDLALEMSKAFGGSMPLRDLLHAAIASAREGSPVSPSQARTVPMEFESAKKAPGFAGTFLVEGEIPKAGAIQTNPALAATLDHLAASGLDDFYRGDVGREIAGDLERIGAPVTREDLRRYRARTVKPLTVALPGVDTLQHAAADPGACVAHDPRHLLAAWREQGRGLRASARPDRGHQAGIPRSRCRGDRSLAAGFRSQGFPDAPAPAARG